jgi:PHD/YefM family antitoxin component YafN of YafNO toxin-antitoxin module
MEIYTVEEFQDRWEEMIERVELGEHIGIVNDDGQAAVMIPADDDIIRIYRDHDEAC